MIAVAVLAAGKSSRMGAPKESLPIRGGTFLSHVFQHSYAVAPFLRIVAVSRTTRKNLIENDIRDAIVVENAGSRADEQIGSIQAAITYVINRPVECVVVWPVDHPNVTEETISRIAAAFLRSRYPVIVPIYKGKRGHPVAFSRQVFHELLAGPDGGARTVVRADPSRVMQVPVDDPGILQDIDTPADYAAWVKAT